MFLPSKIILMVSQVCKEDPDEVGARKYLAAHTKD